jgi:hypothetical protein
MLDAVSAEHIGREVLLSHDAGDADAGARGVHARLHPLAGVVAFVLVPGESNVAQLIA